MSHYWIIHTYILLTGSVSGLNIAVMCKNKLDSVDSGIRVFVVLFLSWQKILHVFIFFAFLMSSEKRNLFVNKKATHIGYLFCVMCLSYKTALAYLQKEDTFVLCTDSVYDFFSVG